MQPARVFKNLACKISAVLLMSRCYAGCAWLSGFSLSRSMKN
jgi:hypothetical protein